MLFRTTLSWYGEQLYNPQSTALNEITPVLCFTKVVDELVLVYRVFSSALSFIQYGFAVDRLVKPLKMSPRIKYYTIQNHSFMVLLNRYGFNPRNEVLSRTTLSWCQRIVVIWYVYNYLFCLFSSMGLRLIGVCRNCILSRFTLS